MIREIGEWETDEEKEAEEFTKDPGAENFIVYFKRISHWRPWREIDSDVWAYLIMGQEFFAEAEICKHHVTVGV